MGSWFSSTKKKKIAPSDDADSKKASVTDKDKATLELKRTRDRLRKNQTTSRNVIAREAKLARELLDKGMKQRAITVLKKKKYQETLLERAEGQILNVEQMMMDLDSAVEMKKVFESLALGNSCLKALQEEMSLDDVDQLMEDTAEALQMHEEMSNALSNNITAQDMGELEDEVMKMMQEMEEEEEKEREMEREKKKEAQKEKRVISQVQTETEEAVVEDAAEETQVEEDNVIDQVQDDEDIDLEKELPLPSTVIPKSTKNVEKKKQEDLLLA